MKKKEIRKSETIEEFLSKGGKITVISSKQENEVARTRQQTSGPAVILTLEEGENLYGEPQEEHSLSNIRVRIGKEIAEVRENFLYSPKKYQEKIINELKHKMDEGEISDEYKEAYEKDLRNYK